MTMPLLWAVSMGTPVFLESSRNSSMASGADHIDCWGTGNASREFIYAGDPAEGILLATEHSTDLSPLTSEPDLKSR